MGSELKDEVKNDAGSVNEMRVSVSCAACVSVRAFEAPVSGKKPKPPEESRFRCETKTENLF